MRRYSGALNSTGWFRYQRCSTSEEGGLGGEAPAKGSCTSWAMRVWFSKA